MDRGPNDLLAILGGYVSPNLARPVLQLSATRARVNVSRMRPEDGPRLLKELEMGLQAFLKDPGRRSDCLAKLRSALEGSGSQSAVSRMTAVTIPVVNESDIVIARGTGRDMCRDLGFPTVVQIKVATTISELARNIVQYAGEGVIVIRKLEQPRPGIEVLATDRGPGIGNLDEIMSGRYKSKSGMGMGLMGTKNLMDDFEIDTAPGEGTRVKVSKFLR